MSRPEWAQGEAGQDGGLGCDAGAVVPGVPGAHLRSNSGLCSLRSRVSRDVTQQFEMEHMRSMSWFICVEPTFFFAQYSYQVRGFSSKGGEHFPALSRFFARPKWASRACALPWR